MTEEFNPKLQKLKQMQSLPLEQKIIVSKQRIKQWLEAKRQINLNPLELKNDYRNPIKL